jgi:hypothetical protein
MIGLRRAQMGATVLDAAFAEMAREAAAGRRPMDLNPRPSTNIRRRTLHAHG